MKTTTFRALKNYTTMELIDHKNNISYTINGNKCQSTRVPGGPQYKYCFPNNMPTQKNADGTETIKNSVSNTTIEYTFERKDGYCYFKEMSSSGSSKIALLFLSEIARGHFSHLSFISFRYAIKDTCGYKRDRRGKRHPNSCRMQEE